MKKIKLIPVLIVLTSVACLYLKHIKITPIENQYKDTKTIKWYDYMSRWNDSMPS